MTEERRKRFVEGLTASVKTQVEAELEPLIASTLAEVEKVIRRRIAECAVSIASHTEIVSGEDRIVLTVKFPGPGS